MVNRGSTWSKNETLSKTYRYAPDSLAFELISQPLKLYNIDFSSENALFMTMVYLNYTLCLSG